MRVFDVNGVPPINTRPLVLAIGKFDGVHIAHQAILAKAKEFLGEGMALGVMCFWPHPNWVLSKRPGYDRVLTPYTEKMRLLEANGVESVYQIQFTKDYASTTAEEFVNEHLTRLNVRHVVVGFDFRFGKGGVADVHQLRELCNAVNIPVTIVTPVEKSGTKVSSSQIRAHLSEGRVEAVESLLDRPYAIVGRVVEGAKLGRQIGFPTANLGETDEYVLPAAGVYAVSVEFLNDQGATTGEHWYGVMNAGYRPTVNGSDFRMEVHVLDFHGDLYGKLVRVSLIRRVRDEMKFASLDHLKEQIAKDVAFTKSIFGFAI